MTNDVSAWLDRWVDNHLSRALYQQNKNAMARDAARCRAAAKLDGISGKALDIASGGDLRGFLLTRQNAMTDAEVRRLSAEGD